MNVNVEPTQTHIPLHCIIYIITTICCRCGFCPGRLHWIDLMIDPMSLLCIRFRILQASMHTYYYGYNLFKQKIIFTWCMLHKMKQPDRDELSADHRSSLTFQLTSGHTHQWRKHSKREVGLETLGFIYTDGERHIGHFSFSIALPG